MKKIITILLFVSCNHSKHIIVTPAPLDNTEDTNILTIPHLPHIPPVIITPLPIEPLPPTPIDSVIPIKLQPFSVSFDTVDNATIQDLVDVLKDYKDGSAINIIKVPIENRTGQAFYISANSTNVEIRYTCENSLENAVYTYLDMLGIRWYGAGENWLYKPTILNTVNIAGEWKEPTFRNRIFAGTGGLDGPMSPLVDPNSLYKKNWLTWKRRNRFNYDFGDGGHTGQAFYLANKNLCDSNSNWFSNNSGKVSGRIKIEVPEAVQAYKAWAISKLNEKNTFNMISTDPEDGRGGSDDPLPPNGFEGIAKWNHADKWWWLTNEVSKEFNKDDNNIKVNAYAYGDGPYDALVPKFQLSKNVYPIIIPYAFQTAYLPNQMIKTWAKSIQGKMGIYDYWNITQWSLGLPQFNIYDISKKLKFWQENKINGMNIETTDAGGPMGHAWWLAGQLEWDLSKDISSLFVKYLHDCFGAGWKPMQTMYNRWSLNYQSAADVNFSLNDLKEATDLVPVNSPEWKRLNDVKAYVHFMKMMAAKSSNDSIYQYIYSIHQRMLVQTAAFTGQRYLGEAPAPLSAHQLTADEVENNFVKDLAAAPLDYSISNMVFDYDRVVYTDSIPNDTWRFGIFAGAKFKAPFTGTVSIDMGGAGTTACKIYSDDSLFVSENIDSNNYSFIYHDPNLVGYVWHMKNFVFAVEEGKIYYISAVKDFSRVKINTAGINLFFGNTENDFDNAGYPIRYFYVPIGTKEIAFVDGEPEGMNGRGYLITANGETLHRLKTSSKDVYKVLVPKGQDGKIWTANFGHSGWGFNNIPNITSLQKFEYNQITLNR
jgi:hypothetical protein